MRYLSHPDQKLTDHIANIAAYCDDALFQITARFHDLGKVLESFQVYIRDTDNHSSEAHAPVSAIIFLLNRLDETLKIQKEDLFVFNAVLSHHGSLRSYNNAAGSDILGYFREEVPERQIDEIYSKDEVIAFFDLKPIEPERFKKLRIKNRNLLFNIEDFVTQKLLFSRLIFADKYEAIFKSAYRREKNPCNLSDLHCFLRENIHGDAERDAVKKSILKAYDKSYNIFTLTAPTGIGKTLTSLELALNIKEDRQHISKIIYVLPFTSIIDQTFSVFDAIFKNGVTKHHYGVTFDEETDEHNDYDRWKFLLNSWNDPFIISTLYQLFFALFSNKNSDNIKFQALQDSVIVIDEVQAIPFELWKGFKALLPLLAQKLNAVFVLMSATMPILTQPELAKELADKADVFRQKNRYRLRYESENGLEALSDKIVTAFRNGQSVLCVVNTIKTAKLLYKMVDERLDEYCYCLNSYMFYEDRKSVIETLKYPGSNQVRRKVLISTQVVEAGVDLDFDVGFREFAPISSIIQTAGRVNREGDKGISDIYIFDTITQIYDGTMIHESKTNLLTALKQYDIYEKDILEHIEGYFKALDDSLGDHGFMTALESFDFAAINTINSRAFRLENDYVKAVAVGVDLKPYEAEFYGLPSNLKPFERKREKEKIIKRFGSKILNIKVKDINALGFKPKFSDVFGVFYIDRMEDIYSSKTGFLIEDEQKADAVFE